MGDGSSTGIKAPLLPGLVTCSRPPRAPVFKINIKNLSLSSALFAFVMEWNHQIFIKVLLSET